LPSEQQKQNEEQKIIALRSVSPDETAKYREHENEPDKHQYPEDQTSSHLLSPSFIANI
jgi:hypothetical protein